MDFRLAQANPPNKRMYVHPLRRDGRHAVTFVYPLSGARIKKLLTPEQVQQQQDGYDLIRVS